MRGKQIHVLASLLMLVGMLGCGDKIDPGTTAEQNIKVIKTSVKTAEILDKPFVYEAVGTLQAQTYSTISSKLMGTVNAIHVHEGDTVKKDDLLIEIDARQVSAGLRKAQAGVAEARRGLSSAESSAAAASAGFDLAEKTYNRYQELLESESVSQQEFDEVSSRYSQAKASLDQAKAMVEAGTHRVQQAEAAVESAKVSKKDASIKAPYDGEITVKMVDVGDLASPGTPLLTIEKTGVFCVSLVIPEEHFHSIHIGQKVDVKIPSMEDLVVTGTIGRIDPSADRQSRTFRVKVALPEERTFNSGVFARVGIPIGQAGMITIPDTAIITRGQLKGIYLVDDNNIARFRLVRTGRQYESTVEILSGMKKGERYVVTPPVDIENGVKVEVGHGS